MRNDLNDILLSVLELQKNKGWKNQQIVLGGMSAGGNLAALLFLDHHQLAHLAVPPSVFAGLLVLGAPLNLDKMHNNLVLRAYAGTKGSEQFRLANPVEHLQKHTPQTAVFCVHGECDGMVPYQSAATFVEIFESIQPEKIQFVSSKNGTHLDAASWGHADPNLKREILSWVKNL
jgi:predicted esterase